MRLEPSRLILFLLSLRGFAQPSERKLLTAHYISRYKDDAVREIVERFLDQVLIVCLK